MENQGLLIGYADFLGLFHGLSQKLGHSLQKYLGGRMLVRVREQRLPSIGIPAVFHETADLAFYSVMGGSEVSGGIQINLFAQKSVRVSRHSDNSKFCNGVSLVHG